MMLSFARRASRASLRAAAPARVASRALATPSGTMFTGVWPIMATPFRPDESLDLEGFAKAVAFMAEAGADGCTIAGVLGESNRLTDAERAAMIEAAVAATAGAGRPFPICVGTSHAGTYATVALSQMARDLGAAAVMVTPTKEAAPQSDAALHAYFAAVADGCPGLPIVLQDHPASTQVFMSADLLVRICADLASVRCIKLEAVPTPTKIRAIRDAWAGAAPPASGDCSILTGLGALYAGFDMEQGTEGFMTGFAFPEILIAMNDAAQAGDFEMAHALYQRYLPLLVFEQQPGVAVRKELYRLRGLIDCGHVRHPGAQIAKAAAAGLEAQIARSLPGADVTKPLVLG